MSIWNKPRWSPYAVGAAIGVLSWGTFGLMGKALGTSTTMVRAVGMLEGAVAPDHVLGNPYFAKYLDGKPGFEWQFALVLAIALGAFLSARLARTERPAHVPSTWKASFGESKRLRYAGAFVGGLVLLFGARLAGGCTSGHGISGTLQLALSSWTFVAATFGVGIPFALLLFSRRSSSHVQ